MASSQPKLILVGVSEPYRTAFRELAEGESLDLLESVHPGALGSLHPGPVRRCVLEAAAGPDLWSGVPALRKLLRGSPIVVLLHAGRIDAAMRLVRLGVSDVIELPADPVDVAAQAWAHVADGGTGGAEGRLVGSSEAMRRLRAEIEAVAPMSSTVLFTGETGTGKGLAARVLHELSGRRRRPFVHIDCGALASAVVESELFGHAKGAFTGANGGRAGRFEAAADGTVLLDEIGEFGLALQAKLLRVLQDRCFERVGETTPRRMEARVIAATNRDLEAEVGAGRFRADLFFRLNVFRIHIPPLRERFQDIPGLTRFLTDRLASRMDMSAPPLPADLCEQLASHSWPGNVRELMNLLEAVLVRHDAGLPIRDWVEDFLRSRSPFAAKKAGAAAEAYASERDVLENELRMTGGNVSRVARRLGIPRSTLRYRIRIHELEHLIPRD